MNITLQKVVLISTSIISAVFLFAQEPQELVNLRTNTSRTYQLSDGSYNTVITSFERTLKNPQRIGGLQRIATISDSTERVDWGTFYYDGGYIYGSFMGYIGGKPWTYSSGSKFRTFVSYDVSSIGDLDLIDAGTPLRILDVSYRHNIGNSYKAAIDGNTLYVKTGNMEESNYNQGDFFNHKEENWGRIESLHSQITTITSPLPLGETSLIIEQGYDGYEELKQTIKDRRKTFFTPHPDFFPLTFIANNETTDSNWFAIGGVDTLVVQWNYGLIPINLRNAYSTGNPGGFLSVDDPQIPGLEYPKISSDTTVYLDAALEYLVTTLDKYLAYQGVSLMHHHWNTNELEITQSHSLDPDPYNPEDVAWFKEVVKASITSVEVSLYLRDPWFVDEQGNQPNTFQEISDSVKAFKDQDADPSNNPKTYYSVYAPLYVTSGGLYGPVSWDGSGAQLTVDPAHPSDIQYRKVKFTSDNASVSANYGLWDANLNATVDGIVIFKSSGTVQFGATFTILPGTEVLFNSGAALKVYGTLNAQGQSNNRITFTRSGTSGTWYGLSFGQNSGGTIKYADISYANYGAYCFMASPTIERNTISNCTYGIRLRYSSPDISYNTITGSSYGIHAAASSHPYIHHNTISNSSYGIYVYGPGSVPSHPYILTNRLNNNYRGIYVNRSNGGFSIDDNRIATSSLKEAGLQLYNSGTLIFVDNTITGPVRFGVYGEYYSGIQAGSARDGQNRVTPNGKCDLCITLYALDHVTMQLGDGENYDENAIYAEEEAGVIANYYSTIYARHNWWGRYPPPSGFSSDGTSYIDHSYPMTYDPPYAGSSLDKSTGGIGKYELALGEPLDTNSVASLWAWGRDKWEKGRAGEAVGLFKILIRKYSRAPEAHWAIVKVADIYSFEKFPGLDAYLLGLINNGAIDDKLQITALELLMRAYDHEGRVEDAIQVAGRIIVHAPGTRHEYHALFNLFNIYQKDVEDSEKAAEVLADLKNKYRDYDLTQIARFDMGEEVDWTLAKRFSAEEEVLAKEILIPGEYALGANYPNPFNPVTTIRFGLPEAARTRLVVYDLLGREVARLVDVHLEAAYHAVVWNGKDAAGREMPSGIYIARLVTPAFSKSIKMVLLK